MIKNIQNFVLGLTRASSKQLKELAYFALHVGLYKPAIFIAFYFVFVFGMEDKYYKFGASTINVREVHILLLVAFMVFVWNYVTKLLRTKLRKNDFGFGQVMVRSILNMRFILLFGIIMNVLMLKFSLQRINIYVAVVALSFIVSVYFEAKYNESAEIEWSDKK